MRRCGRVILMLMLDPDGANARCRGNGPLDLGCWTARSRSRAARHLLAGDRLGWL